MEISRKIVLRFPKALVEEPAVYHLIKDYNLECSILRASITTEEGMVVLGLKGDRRDYNAGIKYLNDTGLEIQYLSEDVSRNEDRCTHCGACVTMCPTNAFEVDAVTLEINFYDEKCIACGICIKGCPPRAMELCF